MKITILEALKRTKGAGWRRARLLEMAADADFEDLETEVEVEEDDNTYTIHAEVPGAKKEDLKVTIDGNQISISAEVKRASEKKAGGRVVHSERYYGNLYRSFALDSAVDEAGGSAKYKDGVLEMVLPKKNSGGPTKLQVS